jgi:biopolymer transport protein ExbD
MSRHAILRAIAVAVAASLAFACRDSSAPPLLELAADGSLSLDGRAITLADIPSLSDRATRDRPLWVRIDSDVAVRHVLTLQRELQRNAVEHVVFRLER